MTGEKTRGTSLEKLWKLDDRELATPKHDELVLSLFDWDYTKNVLSLDDDEFLISIKSEEPITTDRNFIVGYVDIVLHTAHWGTISADHKILFTCPHCGDVFVVYDRYNDIKVDCPKCKKHVCYTSNKKSMDGISHQLLHYPHLIITQFIIECKPSIPSFGETLRQIKTYQQYVTYKSLFNRHCEIKDKSKYPKCEVQRDRVFVSDSPQKIYWVIFSPDTKYSDAFSNEGITLISPTIL